MAQHKVFCDEFFDDPSFCQYVKCFTSSPVTTPAYHSWAQTLPLHCADIQQTLSIALENWYIESAETSRQNRTLFITQESVF